MWASAQRDGRPAEYRWRPLFNAAAWLTPRVPCSNAAKARNPLKFAGVPKHANRSQPLVGRSSPYCDDMWRRYCCLAAFFPIVDTCLSCEDIARQICAIVPRWRFWGDFLGPAFPPCCVQHISDLHSKFALGPRHVQRYGRHPICDRATAEIRHGKKRRRKKKERNHRAKI